jgi:hypothetical protein
MRRSLAAFSEPESSFHPRSWADFITITCGFRFSVHTPIAEVTKTIATQPNRENGPSSSLAVIVTLGLPRPASPVRAGMITTAAAGSRINIASARADLSATQRGLSRKRAAREHG